jgi:hypothetical protein
MDPIQPYIVSDTWIATVAFVKRTAMVNSVQRDKNLYRALRISLVMSRRVTKTLSIATMENVEDAERYGMMQLAAKYVKMAEPWISSKRRGTMDQKK